VSNNGNSMAANLAMQRGNRCAATILTWCEGNVFAQLDDKQRYELRRVVLDNVNAYKDLMVDVVKSDTAVLNDIWVQKIDELRQEVRALRR
jgi:hypothetical protein